MGKQDTNNSPRGRSSLTERKTVDGKLYDIKYRKRTHIIPMAKCYVETRAALIDAVENENIASAGAFVEQAVIEKLLNMGYLVHPTDAPRYIERKDEVRRAGRPLKATAGK